jgi:hypothetical protein
MREVRSVPGGSRDGSTRGGDSSPRAQHDPDVGRLQPPSEVLEATTSKPSARDPVKLGVGLATGQTQHSQVRFRVWIGGRRRSASVDLIAIQPERSGGQGRPTHQRLCNSQYPWHRRDLSDMQFLSCAAGYADFLLAENATSHDLRLAERRVTSGARVCLSPGELADFIEEQQVH